MLSIKDLDPYQVRAVNCGVTWQQMALLLDMGLGKTVISLTILDQLFKRKLIKRALVIAPLKVARNVWRQECEKWSHMQHYTVSLLHGSNKAGRYKNGSQIDILNYDGLRWLRKIVDQEKEFPYDAVIFDESTNMKNPGTERFKQMKILFKKFKYRYIMTGTPVPNHLYDAWAQQYIIDVGEAWGHSFHAFRRTHFFAVDPDMRVWKPHKTARDEVLRVMGPKAIYLSSEDYGKLPEMIFQKIPVVLSDKLMADYKELEREFYLEVDGTGVEVFNSSSLGLKLRQFVQGFLYYNKFGDAVWSHTEKLQMLKEVTEDIGNALVIYEFKEELKGLMKIFPDAKVINGDTTDFESDHYIEEWNKGNIKRLLLSSGAGTSHGLNLQFGGNHLFWYTLTWSLEKFLQFNKRLHRKGQEKPVFIHILSVVGTKDEKVLDVITERNITQSGILAALKR